jgi:hypothetical protein
VKRSIAKDGNPVYSVMVDDTNVAAYEQHVWAPGASSSVSAGRLCAIVVFTGITINKPQNLLGATFDTRGLPSFGMTKEGQPTLHTAFPIAPGYPVDFARRQLMVCMGILAQEANRNLTAWRNLPAQVQRSANVDRAKNVATVAGTFLRAFAGL